MRFYDASSYESRIVAILKLLHHDLNQSLTGVRVEHIGSTAIVGAISKGDLDVFVGVPPENFQEVLAAIKKLGFSEKENTLRTDSLCMLITDKYDYDVAIQLVTNGSEFEDFIRFRDIMNQDPHLVDQYNVLKRECEGMDPDEYRNRKSLFIKTVLELSGTN